MDMDIDMDMDPALHPVLLLRDVDAVSELLQEHSQGLSAMGNSPFYGTFRDEADSLSLMLDRVSDLVEAWGEAQRLWVSMQGVFGTGAGASGGGGGGFGGMTGMSSGRGVSEVAAALPEAASRFEAVDVLFRRRSAEASSDRRATRIAGLRGFRADLGRIAVECGEV